MKYSTKQKTEPLARTGDQIKQEEAICAISSPLGVGGVSVIRLSGYGVISKVCPIFRGHKGAVRLEQVKTHRVLYGNIFSPKGDKLDEVLLLIMRAPNSYTREDVVEIHCHGGLIASRRILEALLDCGVRLAEPGEFTKRAFLNGRIDLSQAEAVMELINSKNDMSYEAALKQLDGGLSAPLNQIQGEMVALLARVEASIDFCEEDIDFIDRKTLVSVTQNLNRKIKDLMRSAREGVVLREGISTVIVGRPNVGKSSLFNALLGRDRAIVSSRPGTTRDLLEEGAMVSGLLLRITDTAGFRQTADLIEQEGVSRGISAKERADLVLVVLDGSEPLLPEDFELISQTKSQKRIFVINKTDRKRPWDPCSVFDEGWVEVSAFSGQGLALLNQAMKSKILGGLSQKDQTPLVATLRQREALRGASASLENLVESARQGMSWEFLALDLRAALDAIGEITGATVTEDILGQIFKDFCIGK